MGYQGERIAKGQGQTRLTWPGIGLQQFCSVSYHLSRELKTGEIARREIQRYDVPACASERVTSVVFGEGARRKHQVRGWRTLQVVHSARLRAARVYPVNDNRGRINDGNDGRDGRQQNVSRVAQAF